MTHDPLCAMAEGKWDGGCQCDVITRVRKHYLHDVLPEMHRTAYRLGKLEEREHAAIRVERNELIGMTLTPKEVRIVIAAIRGES